MTTPNKKPQILFVTEFHLLRNFAFFHKDALSLGIRAEISNDN
jgi:hypothetical protein